MFAISTASRSLVRGVFYSKPLCRFNAQIAVSRYFSNRKYPYGIPPNTERPIIGSAIITETAGPSYSVDTNSVYEPNIIQNSKHSQKGTQKPLKKSLPFTSKNTKKVAVNSERINLPVTEQIAEASLTDTSIKKRKKVKRMKDESKNVSDDKELAEKDSLVTATRDFDIKSDIYDVYGCVVKNKKTKKIPKKLRSKSASDLVSSVSSFMVDEFNERSPAKIDANVIADTKYHTTRLRQLNAFCATLTADITAAQFCEQLSTHFSGALEDELEIFDLRESTASTKVYALLNHGCKVANILEQPGVLLIPYSELRTKLQRLARLRIPTAYPAVVCFLRRGGGQGSLLTRLRKYVSLVTKCQGLHGEYLASRIGFSTDTGRFLLQNGWFQTVEDILWVEKRIAALKSDGWTSNDIICSVLGSYTKANVFSSFMEPGSSNAGSRFATYAATLGVTEVECRNFTPFYNVPFNDCMEVISLLKETCPEADYTVFFKEQRFYTKESLQTAIEMAQSTKSPNPSLPVLLSRTKQIIRPKRRGRREYVKRILNLSPIDLHDSHNGMKTPLPEELEARLNWCLSKGFTMKQLELIPIVLNFDTGTLERHHSTLMTEELKGGNSWNSWNLLNALDYACEKENAFGRLYS